MIPCRAFDRRGRCRAAAPLLVLWLVAGACGKQGPPLPPLHLVPGPATDVVVRRTGEEVRFSFVLPTQNVNGPGPVNLEKVEIYAATVAPGALAPTNRELQVPRFLVGSVPVRQPAKEGAPAPDATLAGPGERVTFVETLDAAKLAPVFTKVAPTPPAPATPTAPPAAAAVAPEPAYATRVYAIRGVSRSGRPGQPAPRVELQLFDLPDPPVNLTAQFTASALTLTWAPATEDAPTRFNIYRPDGPAPINDTPISALTYERAGVEFGKEECFVIRTVRLSGAIQVESPPSETLCVTPQDTFPPEAPKGFSAVAGSGGISLIWDANTEPDLAGYLVLRGEVPGDTLQAITPTPIKETTFRDTTVKPGVRYVYAIVAVDQAKNTSGQSMRVEETAR